MRKKIFIICVASLAFSLKTEANTFKTEKCLNLIGTIDADAGKRVPVNEKIRSTDGTEWTLKGWIDIETVWGWPPVAIVAYELTLSNGTDSWTFKSKASVSGSTGDIQEVLEGEFPPIDGISEIMSEFNKNVVLPNM